MTDNKICTAIVPYVPVSRKKTCLNSLFAPRRFAYALLLPAALSAFVAGAYYRLFCVTAGNSLPFASQLASFCSFSVGTLLIGFFALALAFTVFSPAGGLMILVPMYFSSGVFLSGCYAECGFSPFFALAAGVQSLFLFVTLLYCCELCMRLSVTRQGFKFVISRRNNLPLLVKTAVYTACFAANSLFIENSPFLKGFM